MNIEEKFDNATKEYYKGHTQRFEYQDKLFRSLTDISLVYDLGTWFPFSSYIFAERGAKVVYGCEEKPADYGLENTIPIKCDFKNPPELPQADLVICCECLEHLPYNLLQIRDYLVKLVKDGGYLFLSFPTGGIKKGEWGDVLQEIDDKRHTHLREFPVDKARQFCQETGLTIISEQCIKVPLYCHADGIVHILMRKI